MTRDAPGHGGHWLTEFLWGLIGGTLSIYSFIGWLPVSFGWITPIAMLAVCSVLGALFGVCLAVDIIREKHQKH